VRHKGVRERCSGDDDRHHSAVEPLRKRKRGFSTLR
jgi:hypothetical protein